MKPTFLGAAREVTLRDTATVFSKLGALHTGMKRILRLRLRFLFHHVSSVVSGYRH